MNKVHASKVASFYSGRSIFVTGATGFIGKALVEKLILTCPDLKRVYLLIRSQRGKSASERLDELLECQIFERAKQKLDKDGLKSLKQIIVPIEGDISQENLGISDEQMSELAREVSLVFNSAATVRFTEPMESAWRSNIYSVEQLINFCNHLPKLAAIVHISTAYSNCNRFGQIGEILYEPPLRASHLEMALQASNRLQDQLSDISRPLTSMSHLHEAYSLKDDMIINGNSNHLAMDLDKLANDDKYLNYLKESQCESDGGHECKQLIGSQSPERVSRFMSKSKNAANWFDHYVTNLTIKASGFPNTYTFTKAISEVRLLECACRYPSRYLVSHTNDACSAKVADKRIPIAIVRPSIVGAAWNEPEPGYMDAYGGPTGAIIYFYNGLLQIMRGCDDLVADFVPLDLTVNFLICVAWYECTQRIEKNESLLILDRNITGKKLIDGNIDGNTNTNTNTNTITNDMDQYGDIMKSCFGIHIFNYVSGPQNPMRWHIFTDAVRKFAYEIPSEHLIRAPFAKFINSNFLYEIGDFIWQKLPAKLTDFITFSIMRRSNTGKNSCWLKYKRIRKMTDALTPFTTNEWHFDNTNVRLLKSKLQQADIELYNFDINCVDWFTWMTNFSSGVRRYLLREDERSKKRGKRKLNNQMKLFKIMAFGLIAMLILSCVCIWLL